MPRKISKKLMQELTMMDGKFKTLLDYVRSQDCLRLEVRTEGDAFVYYRKGKALELKGLKVNGQYGNTPDISLALSDPKQYFELMKKVIDQWRLNNIDREEFDVQQMIASCNQEVGDRFIIIDMEYGLEQNQTQKKDRCKASLFDLLGIERSTGKVTLFEVKVGLGALGKTSGVNAHLTDFNCFFGNDEKTSSYKNSFKEQLYDDVDNIIKDKKQLGLITDFELPENFRSTDPEFAFVFCPNDTNKANYSTQINKFEKELDGMATYYLVSKENYKLK